MDDLITEFIEETREGLADIENDLVEMERTPDDPERIARVFRIVHTIKGTCGFIGLEKLGGLAHVAENVLGLLRDGDIAPTPVVVSAVLQSLDQIKDLLGAIETTGEEPPVDISGLVRDLEAIANGEVDLDAPVGDAAAAASESGTDASEDEAAPSGEAAVEETEAAGEDETAGEDASGDGEGVDDEQAALAAAVAQVLGGAGDDEAPALEVVEQDDETFLNDDPELANHLVQGIEQILNMDPIPAAPEAEAAPAAPAAAAPAEKASAPAESVKTPPAAAPAAQGGEAKAAPAGTQTLRVSVELLEQLMTLVSELVLTRNQLLQLIRGQSDSVFHLPLQRLSHVTSELQEGVMKARMQPIGNAWNKLPRIVRDLSLDLGKRISLQMDGADTELDRQVLDLIKDPLTHMVRNSADHGIEGPEERLAANKPEEGTIHLSARHEGGHIMIELRDDGRGLNIAAIRKRIIERGLVSEIEAEGMNEQRVAQFIFAPGFSTAEAVTNVSGRGVGMDVVRTNIEKIGGTIDLRTEEGRGTTFTIKIPLTLAIVSALIVEGANERFAIPQISVQELVRVNEKSQQRIEEINGACLLRLRERLLPLVYLGQALGLDDRDVHELLDAKELIVVVAQLGNYEFGIIVDRVYDTEEIVVKPVAPILRDIKMFSGNTILGDGSVIMILDPNGLAATMSQNAVETADNTMEENDAKPGSRKTPLLIFAAGGREEPKAVPLSLVARLEEFEPSKFENIDERTVVQYRGQLMPVVSVDEGPFEVGEAQAVIVFTERDHSVGLVVDQIMDIGEEEVKAELGLMREGCMGTTVIGGKAMEVIDVSHYLCSVYPDRYGETSKPFGAPTDAEDDEIRILMVDDSAFFRNVVGPFLRGHGYHMTLVDHPEAALALLDTEKPFDAIVSDIEMPDLDGYELLERFKAHPTTVGVPVIALSSHATEADMERGRRAGFHSYVPKLDKNGLLRALESALQPKEIAA